MCIENNRIVQMDDSRFDTERIARKRYAGTYRNDSSDRITISSTRCTHPYVCAEIVLLYQLVSVVLCVTYPPSKTDCYIQLAIEYSS